MLQQAMPDRGMGAGQVRTSVSELRTLQGGVMYATYRVVLEIEGLQEGMDEMDIDTILYKHLKRSEITITVHEILEENQ